MAKQWKTYEKDFLILSCYLLTQTVLPMKSNQKMFMNNFLSTNIYLTLAIIQKTQTFIIVKMKWSLAK